MTQNNLITKCSNNLNISNSKNAKIVQQRFFMQLTLRKQVCEGETGGATEAQKVQKR